MNGLLLASVLLLSQDSEAAPTSKVTEAGLPAGALRALDAAMIEQIAGMLKAVYKDVRIEGVEVLIWPGDYSGEKGAGLRKKAAALLEKDNYKCAEEASPQKIEGREVFVCSATKDGRRVYGLWIGSAEAAMLAWGRNPVAAEGAAIGNVLYTVPKGWKSEVSGETVTMTPPDLLPDEKLFFLILPGKEFSGTLEQSAAELWTAACREFDVDGGALSDRPDVFTSPKGWRFLRNYSQVRTKTTATRLFLYVIIIHVGDRVERVAALSNYTHSLYEEAPFYSSKYTNAFYRLAFGLKFKNHAEPKTVEASLKGEGIVGVWAGVKLGLDGLSGGLQWQGQIAAFYSNGQVFYSSRLQTFLFDGADPVVGQGMTPPWWSTWKMDQGKGILQTMSAAIPMEMKGNRLALTTNKTEHLYERLPPVDGARWDGTWRYPADEKGKAPGITFTEAGHFSDDGGLLILEHSLYTRNTTTLKPGEGTYEVRNWTVLFHYSDGREFQALYLGAGATKGELRPATLVLGFNWDTLKRE